MTALAVRTGPRLLLPPLAEPRPVADPREVVWLHPETRSVLTPPVEQDWSVPEAVPPSRRTLPDPAPVAGAVVLAAVEALAGTRPLVQLSRWLSPEVYDQLAERAPALPRTRVRRATVRSTRVFRVSPTAVEACVVVHDGERVRAAAARLQVHRRHWRVTVLQIG